MPVALNSLGPEDIMAEDSLEGPGVNHFQVNVEVGLLSVVLGAIEDPDESGISEMMAEDETRVVVMSIVVDTGVDAKPLDSPML
jgi:hypothetical protein